MIGDFTTNAKGNITITGLLKDDYTIREKTAPDGYQLSGEEIKIYEDDFGSDKFILKNVTNTKIPETTTTTEAPTTTTEEPSTTESATTEVSNATTDGTTTAQDGKTTQAAAATTSSQSSAGKKAVKHGLPSTGSENNAVQWFWDL